ncbi:MAG: hypothetical protein HKN23_00080 [Verrucomicrobiales bacterium]|nr:hypothetical protein [Verrucomicrobiales bacterium]
MTRVFSILLLFLSPFRAFSQDAAAKPETEKLNLDEFPGEIVEKVVIPVPAEVFAVLDKMDEPNWAGQIRIPEDGARPKTDRVLLAFEFGSFVAEGFVAVQAGHVDEIKTIGGRALKLGNALGLGDAVEPHSKSIVEAAEAGDWKRVRSELDLTQATVRKTMERLRDDDLGSLSSLGGWVRGTHALTSLISENYSRDKAELLNQPDLVQHFIDAIDGMSEPVKTHADVVAVRAGLSKIHEHLAAAATGTEISAETVSAIGQICENLLRRYYFPPAAAAPPEAADN